MLALPDQRCALWRQEHGCLAMLLLQPSCSAAAEVVDDDVQMRSESIRTPSALQYSLLSTTLCFTVDTWSESLESGIEFVCSLRTTASVRGLFLCRDTCLDVCCGLIVTVFDVMPVSGTYLPLTPGKVVQSNISTLCNGSCIECCIDSCCLRLGSKV
jgi:hypothetical protein